MIAALILAGIIVAEPSCAVRSVVVPDHNYELALVTLRKGEYLYIVDTDEIIRRDGYPDIDKINALVRAQGHCS